MLLFVLVAVAEYVCVRVVCACWWCCLSLCVCVLRFVIAASVSSSLLCVRVAVVCVCC